MNPSYIIVAEKKDIIFQPNTDEVKSNKLKEKIIKNKVKWTKIGRFYFKRSLSNNTLI